MNKIKELVQLTIENFGTNAETRRLLGELAPNEEKKAEALAEFDLQVGMLEKEEQAMSSLSDPFNTKGS